MFWIKENAFISSHILIPFISYLNRNYDAEIYAFGQRLGEEFNESTLRQAFINRYVQLVKKKTTNNILLNTVPFIILWSNLYAADLLIFFLLL